MRLLGELTAGNPILVAYLAYIVGLLIAIATARVVNGPPPSPGKRSPGQHRAR